MSAPKPSPFTTPVSFNIQVQGETTGQTFIGTFRAKPALSHADRLARDARFRELLGTTSPHLTAQAETVMAQQFSELFVRLVEVPEWWTASSNGMSLLDETPLQAVYDAAMKVEADLKARIQAEAEAARGALQQQAAQNAE